MDRPCSKAIGQMQKLLQTSRTFIEGEFSPYFYRYFKRYSNPRKFDGYLSLCKYLFEVTEAKDASLLDLGCGFGLMATIFGLYGSKEVVGYDMNTEKIEMFCRLLLYVDSGIKNVKPVLGDSSRIEYPDEYFDVVIANETFSHIREMRESIREVHRVLKIGGRFLLRDGNNSLFLLGRIRRRRFWRMVEMGPVDPSSFRSTDIPLPYFQVRKKMIHEKFPQMGLEKVNFLSRETSGMFGNEIFKAIDEAEKSGVVSKRPKFRYRNPMTGEFPEKELNPFTIKCMLEKMGFEVSFIPHFYSASFKDIEMTMKRLLYWIEKYLPIARLLLTPGFAILGIKRRHV
jgi:ubiquinone/menaquinone biosynthesis C-methylase UbiE